jgi:cytochrome c5
VKQLHTLSLLAAATLAVAACTPSNTRPGSVPTAVKTGQSWVVTRPVVAAQVLDTCSRDSPAKHAGEVTGYWAPSRADIDALESRLAQLQPVIAEPALSGRQYVGFESGGKRLIYINAFTLPDHSEMDPGREAIRVCDGGAQFWGAVYDPQAGTFSSIERNGAKSSP